MQVASPLAVALFAGVAVSNAVTTIHAQPFRAGAKADMSVTADLDGELLLDPSNGHVRSLALSGPVEFTGSAKEGGTRIDLAGKGTWKYDYSANFD